MAMTAHNLVLDMVALLNSRAVKDDLQDFTGTTGDEEAYLDLLQDMKELVLRAYPEQGA